MLKVYYADVSLLGGKEILHKAGRYILRKIVPDGEILTGKDGKPYFEKLPVYFNISHSYPYVVCAFCSCPVGIDIEKVRSINLSAAKRVFTQKELKLLDCGTDFLTLWTAKESAVKAAGGSLLRDGKSFDVSDLKSCTFGGKSYYIRRIDIPGCVCHVATEQPAEQIEISKTEIKTC